MGDEMRERVARALYEAGPPTWAEHVGGTIVQAARLDHYRQVADAVLAAIDLDKVRDEGRREAAEGIAVLIEDERMTMHPVTWPVLERAADVAREYPGNQAVVGEERGEGQG